MKEYNMKRHYCTKHPAKFDGIESQLRFDEIEQLKKSASMQAVFMHMKNTLSLLMNSALRHLR